MSVTPSASRWLLQYGYNGRAALRLFCFPYAGGSASIFRSWADVLPQSIEVCPVQLPGRGSQLQEPPYTELHSLVQAIAQDLLPYLDRPFAIFGHSMGATIGFELARRLRALYSLEPLHLFVSGRGAPQLPNNELRTYDLPQTEFLAMLRRLNGTPGEILESAELMELMLPILRADFQMIQTYDYTPQAPLSCPITVFGGRQDKEAKSEQLEAWRAQTTSHFSLRMFSGNHFFLHPARPLILETIAHELHRQMSNHAHE